MTKSFFLLILLMTGLQGSSQSANSTSNLTMTSKQQTVWNKVIDLHNALFGNKDSVVIAKLVSNSVHYGHSTGLLEDKPALMHTATNNTTAYENVFNQLTSLTILDDVALVRMVLTGTSTDKGVTSPLHLAIIQVWHKEKGTWRIIERQAVKLLK